MRRTLWVVGLMACGVEVQPEPEVVADDSFMVVVLPDTQVYAHSFPETFEAQLKWVADHAEDDNIVFVTHVGDVVQAADRPNEWANANAAYAWIRDIDMPHGVSAGAHDFWVHGGPVADGGCAAEGFTDKLDCDLTAFKEHYAVSADDLFAEFIAVHPNIWGVHCGHVDAEFMQSSTNEAGLPVHEILVDFQDMADGGGGWMRQLIFEPSLNQIRVRTWSPTLERFRANGEGYDHGLDVLSYYQSAAAEFLAPFGFDPAELQALLALAGVEGSEERATFYDSLYGGGQRDSEFVLAVDFQA